MGIRGKLFIAFSPVVVTSLAVVLSAMPVQAGNADWATTTATASSSSAATGGDPPFRQFHERGVGTGTVFLGEDCATAVGDVALTCADADVCHCWTVTIPLKSTVLGKSTLTMDLNFDLSQSVTSGTPSGLCLPGSGIGVQTFPNGATINVGFSGIECDSTLANATLDAFNGNGAFQFNGGSGKFVNVFGMTNTAITAGFGPFGSTVPAAVAVDGSFSK
jgi:hypothetical protein